MIRMRDAGLTLRDIGGRFGVSRTRVWQLIASRSGKKGKTPCFASAAILARRRKKNIGRRVYFLRSIGFPTTKIQTRLDDGGRPSEADRNYRYLTAAKAYAKKNRLPWPV